MFMESLVAEVDTLARRFTSVEALKRAGEDGKPVNWYSPRGMLDFVIACDRISDISTRIAKAGYWECDRELLNEISAESRHILYSISNLRRPLDELQP